MKNAGEISVLAGVKEQQGIPFGLVLGTLRKEGTATATSGLEAKSPSDRGGGFHSFLNAAGFFRTPSKESEPVSALPREQPNPKTPEPESHQNPRARRHSTAPATPQKALHQAAATEPAPIPLALPHVENVTIAPAAVQTRVECLQYSAAPADAHPSILRSERLPEGGSKTPEARSEIGLERQDRPESVNTDSTDWIGPSAPQEPRGRSAQVPVQKAELFSVSSRPDISEKAAAAPRSESGPQRPPVEIDAVVATMPERRQELSMPSKPLPFDLVDGNLAEPISVAGLRPVEGVHPRIQGEANARKSFKLVGEQPQAGTAPLPRSQSTDRRAPSVEPTAHAAVPAPDAQIANRRHPIQSSSRPHGFEAQPQPPERISPGSIHPSVTLTSPGTVRGTAQEASVRIPFEVSTPDRTSLPKAAAAERVSPEIFDVLDTDAPAASPQWTHAGTHRLEAGFQDPEVGWVRVRAQQDSGGVHAAVVPASSDASQILSSHLTGLSNYLVEHRTLIESWALAPPENLPEATGASQTGGDATRQERGRDAHPGAPGDESGRGASWASRDGPWATEQRQPISAVPVYEALGNGRYVSLLV